MASRDEDFGADLALIEGDDGILSSSASAPAREAGDGRSLYEQAHARAERERSRADAAEARCDELRRAEVDARARAGSLKWQADANRTKLQAAREETKDVRRAAKNALALQAEVTRLEKLLSEAGIEPAKRRPITKADKESRGPRATPRPVEHRKATIDALRAERGELRKEVTRLNREVARLAKRLAREEQASEKHKETIRQQFDRDIQLRATLRRLRDQSDRVRSLSDEVFWLRIALDGAKAGKAAMKTKLAKLLAEKKTLSGPIAGPQLRAALARSWRQKQTIKSQSREIRRLRRAMRASEAVKARDARHRAARETLTRALSNRTTELRVALRRSRRQKAAIKLLSRKNARLRKAAKSARTGREKAEARLREAVRVSRRRIETLEAKYARLRASAVVLQKALFGSRSEQQDKPRSERKRGQQPGAAGHGRTQRPALEEKKEERNPPRNARMCSCCGKPYVMNGERSSTIIEIAVKAHTRRIVRPRWRRGCDCASSPSEVSAPPVPRLFPRTPYGTSVWACFLFERYACLRPLHRVSAWMSDQGLPISVGTLADSVPRFMPLFEPFDEAIRTHQSEAAVRHGDESVWRIESLRETGRSSRAWLWTSVSDDAVYFHIDPSRSAKVATQLFGGTACILFLVCDRLSSYKTMAHELGGAVILCWCWAHQRRDFIHGAAGQAGLTHWCQTWIERIASIYKLNEARLGHYDPALERQTAAFAQAQAALEAEVERLFADAEQELAALPVGAREIKALRSLLNHRSGLSVFVDKPQVPMDNNAAERALRGPVIGRRLSFGSDSEIGARFTALMYSVVATLKTNGIDVRRWLETWLRACDENGGQPPDDLSPWLPWSMSEERRRALLAPG